MLHLEASSVAVGLSAAWEETAGHGADCSLQGLDVNGDGDKVMRMKHYQIYLSQNRHECFGSGSCRIQIST